MRSMTLVLCTTAVFFVSITSGAQQAADAVPIAGRAGMIGAVRVAYTLEQCWHRVPGGTGVAAMRIAVSPGYSAISASAGAPASVGSCLISWTDARMSTS